MGVEVVIEGLTRSFGRQVIWEDVSLTLPAGAISALLGPSGAGKTVFLRTLVRSLRPDRGRILVDGRDLTGYDEPEIRRLFGVLFQDGALPGAVSLYDNLARPLREHTGRTEAVIRRTVMEKLELVGLLGAEGKLPGEISPGMRKRAGLARALILDPEIVLCDEPVLGLDRVRTAYLNQLIVDLNAATAATFLILTHDVATARTVPDDIGLLFRRELVMFGPREKLLSCDEPLVRWLLDARRTAGQGDAAARPGRAAGAHRRREPGAARGAGNAGPWGAGDGAGDAGPWGAGDGAGDAGPWGAGDGAGAAGARRMGDGGARAAGDTAPGRAALDAVARGAEAGPYGGEQGRLAPIPPQLMPSGGRMRRTQRPPGAWLAANKVVPPPGSFVDERGRDWLKEYPRLFAAGTYAPEW
ncbi:hypothetical protein Misp01_56390 [Microtetraspora sp. NBRC 13810]|uniref:ABC transporter ATP-binding protein n=1 Tax=Microtetraspora sp. NBRC 13810 TaxID=3030990 RepID=UPI0024A4DADF|nr:ATP-binding cassette domain-containing protein [Microtetraspora sp. NBRC 13810]GLW10511.1 hypothetical protein Misp01_56390 [Microtetraspora sp. NBRC 13810]